MFNVLVEDFPTEWEGYAINTGFHIGVQISLLMDDEFVPDNFKSLILLELLFGNEDGSIRAYPTDPEELQECVLWFLNGWHTDNAVDNPDNEKVMDYQVDQGRIYADFLQIYGIDLAETEMHWWRFQWLLWNMPNKYSSFLQTIEIRTRKPSKGASHEEIKAIKDAQAIYSLKKKKRKEYTKEEEKKIDDVDLLIQQMKKEAKEN